MTDDAAPLPITTLQQADLNGLVVFARVAETLNFTAAARSLGMSPSAVSQSIRALETRVGAPLINRTTRQVGLTEAGEALLAGLRPALNEISAAMGAIRTLSGRVTGRLRINAPRAVAPMLWRELLVPFGRENPELHIEVSASDSLDRVFAEGFDAGVRLSEDLELDVTAFRISEPFQMGVFASPALLDAVGRPTSVDDLDPRLCIRFRTTQGQVRNWAFRVGEGVRELMPEAPVTVDDAASNLEVAAAGGGFAYGAAPVAAELVAAGRLEQVLPEYAPLCSGLFLYYPSSRRTLPKLRALIAFVQKRGRYKAAVMPPSTKTAEPVR